MGTARNCTTVYWAELNSGNAFLTYIQDVMNSANPPLVHSLSYGYQEQTLVQYAQARISVGVLRGSACSCVFMCVVVRVYSRFCV